MGTKHISSHLLYKRDVQETIAVAVCQRQGQQKYEGGTLTMEPRKHWISNSVVWCLSALIQGAVNYYYIGFHQVEPSLCLILCRRWKGISQTFEDNWRGLFQIYILKGGDGGYFKCWTRCGMFNTTGKRWRRRGASLNGHFHHPPPLHNPPWHFCS